MFSQKISIEGAGGNGEYGETRMGTEGRPVIKLLG